MVDGLVTFMVSLGDVVIDVLFSVVIPSVSPSWSGSRSDLARVVCLASTVGAHSQLKGMMDTSSLVLLVSGAVGTKTPTHSPTPTLLYSYVASLG